MVHQRLHDKVRPRAGKWLPLHKTWDVCVVKPFVVRVFVKLLKAHAKHQLEKDVVDGERNCWARQADKFDGAPAAGCRQQQRGLEFD